MIQYEKTCQVDCTDNGKSVEAEIMDFKLENVLTVVVATNKIVMMYKKNTGTYVGNLMGLEFTSKGPKYYDIKQRR